MSLEDDDTSNLSELTPISSNQHVKKAIQNSAVTTVDSSVNVSLKTLMSSKLPYLRILTSLQILSVTN